MKYIDDQQLERLAAACRQLGYALQSSDSLEAALRAAFAAADPDQSEALRQLERLLRSEVPEHSPFAALGWAWRQAGSPERVPTEVIAEFRRRQLFIASTASLLREAWSNSMLYLTMVLAVLTVVRFTFGHFVMPGFTGLYSGFGTPMPQLTNLVFGGAAPLFSLLLIGGLALLVFLIQYAMLIRRRLRCDSPMPAWWLRVPFVGQMAGACNEYLWMSYTALLQAAGLGAAESLKIAGDRFPGNTKMASATRASALSSDLQTAERLGRLSDEIRFQRDASADHFVDIAMQTRRRVRVGLSLIVYVLVAIIVAAMYLPIFSLGSNI